MKITASGCVFFLIAAAAFAEPGGGAAAVETAAPQAAYSEHFEVISDSGDGEALAVEMEERFSVYNRLFRFNPDNASLPLRVRAFRELAAYNEYVSARHGTVNPGAVYLHYNQGDRRELVIHRGGEDTQQALAYQSFIQFLRAFVSNPPAWIREGFAVFFSTLGFNDEGKLVYEENLAWLEPVKNRKELPSAGSILMADALGIPDDFQTLAWSMVSFLLNSGKRDYLRTMTDSFMLLSDAKTAEENAGAVMQRIFLWNNMEDMNKDYHEYLVLRKTFNELLAQGQKQYADGDKPAAVHTFQSALDQKPNHFAPWYYLGLLAYEAGDHTAAEEYYRSSMRYGADAALIHYALGLNAAAAGKNSEAVELLRTAAELSPARYKEKAGALVTRISS